MLAAIEGTLAAIEGTLAEERGPRSAAPESAELVLVASELALDELVVSPPSKAPAANGARAPSKAPRLLPLPLEESDPGRLAPPRRLAPRRPLLRANAGEARRPEASGSDRRRLPTDGAATATAELVGLVVAELVAPPVAGKRGALAPAIGDVGEPRTRVRLSASCAGRGTAAGGRRVLDELVGDEGPGRGPRNDPSKATRERAGRSEPPPWASGAIAPPRPSCAR